MGFQEILSQNTVGRNRQIVRNDVESLKKIDENFRVDSAQRKDGISCDACNFDSCGGVYWLFIVKA